MAFLSPCPQLFHSCRCTNNLRAPPNIYTLCLIPAIHHSQSHTSQSLHLSVEEVNTHAKLSKLQEHAHTEAFPCGAHWCPVSRAGKRLEVLEGTKMDVKWHKHRTDGRIRKWSSTVHWSNIMQLVLLYVNSCIEYFQRFKSPQQKGSPLKEYLHTYQVWKTFPSSIRQDYIFIGSLTWLGSAIWAGLHETVCTFPQEAPHWTEMIVMLSSLDKLLQLKFGLGHWKKSPNVKTMHCYPLEPGTSVFCENPSASSKTMANSPALQEEETFFRTKQQPTWPTCLVLVMNKPRQVPASVEGLEGTFPSSLLGGCSSALQVPKQAYKN